MQQTKTSTNQVDVFSTQTGTNPQKSWQTLDYRNKKDVELELSITRVNILSHQGFIQSEGGGGPGIPPQPQFPPPEILKLSMVIIVVSAILAI